MLHCNSVSHCGAFPRARCNTIQHTFTHTLICNTNVYKYNSGHSIYLEYSVVLMNRTPYFLCDGNHNIEATEIIGEAKTLVRKASQLTGKLTEILVGIDFNEFVHSFYHWNAGLLIQDAFPTLSADEREFIKTGITPEEWKAAFGDFE